MVVAPFKDPKVPLSIKLAQPAHASSLRRNIRAAILVCIPLVFLYHISNISKHWMIQQHVAHVRSLTVQGVGSPTCLHFYGSHKQLTNKESATSYSLDIIIVCFLIVSRYRHCLFSQSAGQFKPCNGRKDDDKDNNRSKIQNFKF